MRGHTADNGTACPFCSKIINANDFIAFHKPLAMLALIKLLQKKPVIRYIEFFLTTQVEENSLSERLLYRERTIIENELDREWTIIENGLS